jgi:hypothetical protein
MANATEIIVDAGMIGGAVILVLAAGFQFLKRSPSSPSSGGGRRTRRARRANGTRRS